MCIQLFYLHKYKKSVLILVLRTSPKIAQWTSGLQKCPNFDLSSNMSQEKEEKKKKSELSYRPSEAGGALCLHSVVNNVQGAVRGKERKKCFPFSADQYQRRGRRTGTGIDALLCGWPFPLPTGHIPSSAGEVTEASLWRGPVGGRSRVLNKLHMKVVFFFLLIDTFSLELKKCKKKKNERERERCTLLNTRGAPWENETKLLKDEFPREKEHNFWWDSITNLNWSHSQIWPPLPHRPRSQSGCEQLVQQEAAAPWDTRQK